MAANKVSENKITGIQVLEEINPKEKTERKSPKSWGNEVKSYTFS